VLLSVAADKLTVAPASIKIRAAKGAVLLTTSVGLLSAVAEVLPGASLRLVRQPQGGQRDTHEADAEFLQRPAARDGSGQALGQFIEFVVHNFPFPFYLCRADQTRAS